MEMAYKADMDIINLSLGENGGWAEDPLAVVADRIVDAGVHGEFGGVAGYVNARKRIDNPCIFNIVVVASGDSGANGIFLTAAPATGRKVISTGSIDNHLVAGHLLYVKGLPFDSIGK
jgi:hypothetical protein